MMGSLKGNYKRSVHSIRTDIKAVLPRCDVSKNYRQRILHALEEAYAGLTWVA